MKCERCMAPCGRCKSYAVRLDELNKNFNLLWDYIKLIGKDPEVALTPPNKTKRSAAGHAL